MSGEHFLAVNENVDPKKSPAGSTKSSKTTLNYIESNFPYPDNSPNFDEEDETNGDKSATLKANNGNMLIGNNLSPIDTNIIANIGDRRMDRFNSEKSIYYSSVLIRLIFDIS